MTVYIECPNKCGGEVPCESEVTDDGADGVWSLGSYVVAFISDDENKTTHETGCPALTEGQREEIEKQATEHAREGDSWEPDYASFDLPAPPPGAEGA